MSRLLPWIIVCPSVLLCRIVSMVMTLREWAQKSLSEEAERPDSFLERFRGPAHNDMQAAPSRFSHSRTGSDADNEIRRSRCRQEWKYIQNLLTHMTDTCKPMLRLFDFIPLRKRRCHVVVLSPSDDAYYHWLIVIGAAVFYNWTFLVVRSEVVTVPVQWF